VTPSGKDKSRPTGPSREVDAASAERGAATLRFRRSRRLTNARQFQAVYAGKVRGSAGPITAFALPNGLAHCRLGLSVGRRVGGAVKRNAVKRRLREAFRLLQPSLAAGGSPGLDLVINVAPHELLKMQDYRELLGRCTEHVRRVFSKRIGRRRDEPAEADEVGP